MGENYLGAPTAMTTTNEGGHAMAIEHKEGISDDPDQDNAAQGAN